MRETYLDPDVLRKVDDPNEMILNMLERFRLVMMSMTCLLVKRNHSDSV